MAAFNFDDYDYEESADGITLAAILNWAGAFLSIVLIAGLASWGWKLWVRDVSGVPVVRALEGPMRITPDDPGGLASEYQGLSVNRIAEERTDENLADQVVLAPQPLGLSEDEDLAMSELQPAAPDLSAGTEELALATEAPLEETAVTGEGNTVTVMPAPAFPEEETDPLAAVTGEVEPTGTDLAVALALGLADGASTAQPAVLTVDAAPGVPVVTPRPLGRPANLQAVSYQVAADGQRGEIDPATVPPGTRLVQLGAFGSRDVAQQEWDRTQVRFGNYMAGKERVVQEAQTGGRTFYRLRAMGFSDLADARRFCSVLVSDGANCIPVVQE